MTKRQSKETSEITLAAARNSDSAPFKISKADRLAMVMLSVLKSDNEEAALDTALEFGESYVFDEVLDEGLRMVKEAGDCEETQRIKLLHFVAAFDVAQRTPTTC